MGDSVGVEVGVGDVATVGVSGKAGVSSSSDEHAATIEVVASRITSSNIPSLLEILIASSPILVVSGFVADYKPFRDDYRPASAACRTYQRLALCGNPRLARIITDQYQNAKLHLLFPSWHKVEKFAIFGSKSELKGECP